MGVQRETNSFFLKGFATIYTKLYLKGKISMNLKRHFIFECISCKMKLLLCVCVYVVCVCLCVCVETENIIGQKIRENYFFFMDHKLQYVYLVL